MSLQPEDLDSSRGVPTVQSERCALEILQRRKDGAARWRERNRATLRAQYRHYNSLPQSKESKRRLREEHREEARTYARNRRIWLKERAAEERAQRRRARGELSDACAEHGRGASQR